MKTVGIYVHQYFKLAEGIKEELKTGGVQAFSHECFCRINSSSVLEDIAVVHPGDKDEKCFLEIRKKIKENPKTKFYVFSFKHPEREIGIGSEEENKNLRYVKEENIKGFFLRLFGEARRKED